MVLNAAFSVPLCLCVSVFLVRREAVQQPRTAGADQVRLAAAAARVSGVPRAVVAALLIGVSELHGSSTIGIAGVIVASVIHAVGISAPVGLRSGQDVMLIRHVAHAVHGHVLFRQ